MSETLNASTIEFYANAVPGDLEYTCTNRRMEVIRLLTTHMFNQAADHSRVDSFVPSPHDFHEAYEALTNLAKSFSHSAKFCQLIIGATDWTVIDIENDSNTLTALRLWQKIPLTQKQKALEKIVRHFITACKTLSGIDFVVPATTFFREGKDHEGDVTMGYYTDIRPDFPAGNVALNVHRNAFFYTVCDAAATALHEAVHAVQDQMGAIAQATPRITRSYAHDSHLAMALTRHKAIIHYKLDIPYRAQFHERLAYSADERFYSKLEAIL